MDSRTFVGDVYKATASFPVDERFGLSQQLRRAAISVTSNVAEGAGRGSPREFARFLRIAVGSACEVEAQLDVSHDLGFLNLEQHGELLADLGSIRRRLIALERRVGGSSES